MPEVVHPVPKLPPDLDTPALVVELDVLQANVDRMAAELAARGVALRPHFKTHKSVRVARMQLDAGAVGITCATLGEAEVLAEAGFEDVFVAYPVIAAGRKAERLRALHERTRLMVGVESEAGARLLAQAVGGTARALPVLIEVDCNYGRTGVRPEDAARIARACGPELEVAGVFAHGGHAYRDPDLVERAARDEVESLTLAAESLEAAGFEARIVSPGSTPTALLSARGTVTEERPGTYPFGDRQQVHLGACRPEEVALHVASTVVSAAAPDRFVLDAGAKTLSKDLPEWLPGYGAIPEYPQAVIAWVTDHHAVVEVPAGAKRPTVGDVLAIVPNHVCPVVNLSRELVIARAGTELERWPVDAGLMSG